MKDIKDSQPKYKNKYQINVNNFKIIKEIHAKPSCAVYSVQNIKTDKYYAAKVIKREQEGEQIQLLLNYNFTNIICFHHPTLIKYYGYSNVDFKGEKNVTLIMDLASNSTLTSLIDKAQNGIPNRYYKSSRQIILTGIARGMMYLHDHHILHRNLNSSNIFLDEHYRPLIANYGFSRMFKGSLPITQDLSYQKAIYYAPEVLSNNICSFKSDVYSFGILMFEVLTDTVPYPLFQKGKMSALQFVKKVVKEDYRPKVTTPLKKSLKRLIERCLSKNPHDRPSFEEIFNMLAYNIEDSILDPPDEKDSNDHNYYLDSSNTDELFTYIDLITQNDIDNNNNNNESLKNSYDELKRDNELLKKDNEQMRQQISLLKKQNLQLAKKYEESFYKEIVPLKNSLEELKKTVLELHSQHPKRPEIPLLPIQKRKEEPVEVQVEEEESNYNSNSVDSIEMSETLSSTTFDDTEESNAKKSTHTKKKTQNISSDTENDQKSIQNKYKKEHSIHQTKKRDLSSSSSDSERNKNQIKSRKEDLNKTIQRKKYNDSDSNSSTSSNESSSDVKKQRRNRERSQSLKSRNYDLNSTLRRVASKSDTEDTRDSDSPRHSNQSFRYKLGQGGKTSSSDDESDLTDKRRQKDKNNMSLPIKKNERNSVNEREFYYLRKNQNDLTQQTPASARTSTTTRTFTTQNRTNSPSRSKEEEERKQTPPLKKNDIRTNSPSRKTKEEENKPQIPSQKRNELRMNSPSRKLNQTLRKSSDEDRIGGNSEKTNERERKFFSPRYKPELLLHLSAKKNRDDDDKSQKEVQTPPPKPTPLIKKFDKVTDDERGPSSPRKKNDIFSDHSERGLSSPRKKASYEDRSPNKKNEDDKSSKLNAPRYKSDQSVRLPMKVESPKDDDDRELLSPRARNDISRLSLNSNNSIKDEDSNDEDDQVLHSPRYKPPDFNETNIALDRFNALPLKFQKSFISEYIKKTPNKIDQDLILIKECLRYLLQFNPSINSIHYFSVSTNKPKESYTNVNEWCQDINEIHLLSAATEILYLNDSLDSSEFIDIIKQFGSVSIEIKYPSENFEGTFEIATNIKNSKISKLKLAISISGIATSDEIFRKNKDINSVKLDSTVTNIGKNSFRSCSNLVYVLISSSIKSIGNDAFRKCSSLTQITIPSSVTSIGEGAFSKCPALRQITIPSSVTYIGEWAFNECSNLRQINLPDSVSQMGEWAFSGCSSLKQFVIPKSVKTIGVSTFADCSSLTKITIPSSVTTIGNWAFCKCNALVSVLIPSSVVSIGEGAFNKCFSLREIEIPPKVTIIRTSTFAECSSLESLLVPSSVTTIEDQAFAGCFSLNEVILPRSVTSIGFWAFPSNTVIQSEDQ